MPRKLNKIKYLLFYLITALFVAINSSATNYYISVNGSDANSGDESNPFKTIQKAASLMVAGDVCTIRAGVYRETLMPANSGTAAAPIKFMAYPGEYVEVNGCDVVTGWLQHKDFIYSAAFSSKVTQVFANGRMVNLAQYPDKRLNYLDNDDLADVEVSPNKTATIEGANFGKDALKDATFVALCGTRWVTIKYAVPKEYAGQKVEFRLDTPTGKLLGTYTTQSTGGWDTWVEKIQAITLFSGKHTIYIMFKGGSGVGNFDWFYLKNSNPTGIETLDQTEQSIKIFPNPVKDQLNIELFGFKNNQLTTLTDLFGEIVLQEKTSGNKYQINTVSNLKAGF